MFTCAKKHYRLFSLLGFLGFFYGAFVFAKNAYSDADFGAAFGKKTQEAGARLGSMQAQFAQCASLCAVTPLFLQSLVFPEVMRYQQWKDDIETESLRALYIQFGSDYADFSVGLFQMKPSFAEVVETKVRTLLPPALQKECALHYSVTAPEAIREERLQRLTDADWQLVYLTAFVAVCNKLYRHKSFLTERQKLIWYATVYNAGFNRTDAYLEEKIRQSHFYLEQGMPGKRFNYGAVSAWYHQQHTAGSTKAALAEQRPPSF